MVRAALCGWVAACLGGCGSVETAFDVVAFKDADTPTVYTQPFPDGAFAQDAHRRFDIVFERTDTTLQAPNSDPAVGAEIDAEGGAAIGPDAYMPAVVQQLVRIRVFWVARPGTTFAQSTQTNASIAYTLQRGGDTISYQGAGFVYFKTSRDGETITGGIESSTLYPLQTSGHPDDYFGPCRLSGEFIARADRRAVVRVLRGSRQTLGPPPVPQVGPAPPRDPRPPPT